MKRTTLTLLFLILCTTLTMAQSKNDTREYIERFKKTAIDQERRYGIPATITLAQGILESGSGKSGLTRNAHNHFGMKCGKGWKGQVYLAWDDDPYKSSFRVYANDDESFRDHAELLKNNKRYAELFTHSIYDYRGWANGLQRCGYATSKHYAQGLIGVIDSYQLYLINGGVKLKPGKTVTIVRYKDKDKTEPVFDEECQMAEEEESEEEASVARVMQRYVVEINNVRCTVLYPGQTLAHVAMKYDIEKSKLLEYNELASEAKLQDGDIVYLEKKKKKYEGLHDYYRVKEGDTMHSISQEFGIRMASLCKLNKKNEFSILHDGERLELK
ncbi:MAG: glucosaminidase domain-containing protein [Bacteroidales bacterium]|nr:glucosaminidase domain-containing protein [Candidatus Physcousia equi]